MHRLMQRLGLPQKKLMKNIYMNIDIYTINQKLTIICLLHKIYNNFGNKFSW
jgi:hypothetical protein